MPLFPILRDGATAEFLDGCERGEFLLVRDRLTGQYLDIRWDTSEDPARFERVTAQGTGRVVSWSQTLVRSADDRPRNVVFGIVQLAEGPWWWSELRPERGVVSVGSAVRVVFEKSGPGPEHATIPVFVTIDRVPDRQ